jgi:S1-C subfamily serine protease
MRRTALLVGLGILLGFAGQAPAQDFSEAIRTIKPSVVAIGTFQRTRTPPFVFRGTGFVIGEGLHIATNAHVMPANVDASNREVLSILLPLPNGQVNIREVRELARDQQHDLAIVGVAGEPLRALKLGEDSSVQEGNTLLVTGFPLGNVLGPHPSSHRVMVSAIPPMVLPAEQSARLDAMAIRQLASGGFPVFQLDGTAMPGNSGSPLVDPASRAVVGIVNMTLVLNTRQGATGAPAGIAFAIPVSHLARLLEQARKAQPN